MKIKSKNKFLYSGTVYDLTIEKTHSYNVEGLSVHNSAAGCLLSYCLSITNVDPIRFDLYFERFLNPTRKSLPDIDIDFQAGTDEITLQFLFDKYGKDRVFPVITFGTFNEKGCLKDVVRALGGDTGLDSDVAYVTKEMPHLKWDCDLETWFKTWSENEKCSERVRSWLLNPSNKYIMDVTIKMQGQIRNLGKHAAGIVITPGPVWESMPVNMVNGFIVSGFQESGSGKNLSDLGILKLDRLKLETLNIKKDAIALIKDKKGVDVTSDVEYVNVDNKELYDEILIGNNCGIFQFESEGINSLLKNIKLNKFDELVASNALYRPGPMNIGAHDEFVKNKFNPEKAIYAHNCLAPLLKDTNGVLIYQEQLMFIAHEIGGLSLGEGDNLRKVMDAAGKIIAKTVNKEVLSDDDKKNKNYKQYLELWNKFKEGAKNKGLTEKEVADIEGWLVKYLGYSFNKSHSVCYAYIAAQTLFLKRYYPTEYYTSLLNHPKSSGSKEEQAEWVSSAILAAMTRGIKITTPTRKSNWGWTMIDDNTIAMGMSSINGMGEVAYNELKNLDFANMTKETFFATKFSKFTKANFEACLKAGLFDDWSQSRELLSEMRKIKIKTNNKQLDLFGSTSVDIMDDFLQRQTHFQPTSDEIKNKEFLQVCYLNLDFLRNITELKSFYLKKYDIKLEPVTQFENVNGYYYFFLEKLEKKKTVRGKDFYDLTVNDGFGKKKLKMWSDMYTKNSDKIALNKFFVSKFVKNNGFLNFNEHGPLTVVDF